MATPLTVEELRDYSPAVESLTSDVGASAVLAALESAWEEAEGYLRTAEYALPLPAEAVTTTLRRKAYALAEWDLFCRAGFDPTSGSNELLRTRYEDAVEWWGEVAKGRVQPIPRTLAGYSNDATPTVEESPRGVAVSGTPRNWSAALD